jgi:hypothetical protein
VITNPANLIFLVGLMENDDAKPDAVRAGVDAYMTGNLFSEPTTQKRSVLVKELLDAFSGALHSPAAAGPTFPFNMDDVIGPVQELQITALDLGWAAHRGSWEKRLTFNGDGARYQVDFILDQHP